MVGRSSPIAILARQATSAHGLTVVATLTCGMYAFSAGIVTLIGWAFDMPRLTDWGNNGISMFPNTAACATLGGAALLLVVKQHERRWQLIAVRAAASIMAVIAVLTLFEHLTSVNLG